MSNNKNKQPQDLTDYAGISQSDEASTITPMGILLGCAKRGRDRTNECKPSICKVSRILRDLSESSFNPQLVSIGPIHREDPKLQEFEWLKECYLNDLLHRCRGSTPKKTLEACLLKVNTLIDQIRESYAGRIKKYSDDQVATMMVIDGCFILEFCFKLRNEVSELTNKMQNSRIAMDLLLLENQFPFFVLQALFKCTIGRIEVDLTLRNLLDRFLAGYIMLFCLPEKNSFHSNVLDKYLAPYIKPFCSLLPEKFSTTDLPERISTTDVDSDLLEKFLTTDVDSDSTQDHLLGYLHKHYHLVGAKSWNPKQYAEELQKPYKAFGHSIVELDRSGMNFKRHQGDKWSMTIQFQSSLFACLSWFWSKPNLLMPTLVIHDFTELILRNLIAYEQSFLQDRYYFSSYAHVMDTLINTQEDIAKLVESEVLVNKLSTNQQAADMINKICKNSLLTDIHYIEEFKHVDDYYKSYWPKQTAWLRRVYFSNPWNSIALLAAIILFTLTVVQTYYTILGK